MTDFVSIQESVSKDEPRTGATGGGEVADDLTMSPSQTLGPMYSFSLIFDGSRDAVAPDAPGAIAIRGRVFDGDGVPLAYPDALVEIWQGEQFARDRTDKDGYFHFHVLKPQATEADGITLAPCLNLVVFARGLLKQVHTRVFFPDEEAANAADPVLAQVPEERRPTLIAQPDGDGLVFDVRLQGPGETVFFAF